MKQYEIKFLGTFKMDNDVWVLSGSTVTLTLKGDDLIRDIEDVIARDFPGIVKNNEYVVPFALKELGRQTDGITH